MRLATFNVLSGRSPADGRVDALRFVAAIEALDADVLTLQEVDRGQERSGGLDLTALAGEAMAAPHRVFAPALYGTPGGRWRRAGPAAADGGADSGADRGADGDDGDAGPAYGCALLSRLPLTDVAVVRMPALPVAVPLLIPGHGVVVVREEPRVALVACVGGAVTVVATHLPFTPGWNRLQLRRLVRAVDARPDPLVLLGDLNLAGDAPARLTGWTPLVTGPTFPAARPRRQLDHALVRRAPGTDGSVRVAHASIVALPVSDHRAVVVDLDLG